ncbi:DUF5984 family protein [Paenibacillus sp. SC116]|uniref:DUF5984 family protein n=1 Tax=Paenibacillus sp. SC116 TaxID=2968986 RepID=UPI00215AB9B8|nr:DUF5984 family protein [Paenibacillus sp. SC116]MCR8843335.1 DUF5984 family protein [Paenibacillus sp. SC116]
MFLIRNNDQLYVYWFAEYKHENGMPIWESQSGEFSCNYNDFVNELIQNFKSFGLEMRTQISQLLENQPVNVEIDSEQIILNQKEYEDLITKIENEEFILSEEHNWNDVLNKANEVINKSKD